MFNLSGSELVFIVLLALVVLGPEKLPDAMRRFGKTFGELRRMGTGFQQEFRSGLDGPMKEMRDTANLIRRNVDIGATGGDKPKSPSLMSTALQPDDAADDLDDDADDENIDDDFDDGFDDDFDDDEAQEAEEAEEAEAPPASMSPTDEFGAVPASMGATVDDPAAPPARDGFGAVPAFAARDDSEVTADDGGSTR